MYLLVFGMDYLFSGKAFGAHRNCHALQAGTDHSITPEVVSCHA